MMRHLLDLVGNASVKPWIMDPSMTTDVFVLVIESSESAVRFENRGCVVGLLFDD